jgi:hypothetical protein
MATNVFKHDDGWWWARQFESIPDHWEGPTDDHIRMKYRYSTYESAQGHIACEGKISA